MKLLLLIIGALVSIPAIIVGSILLNGYALSILWGWFMVPLHLPALGLAHAVGIATLIGTVTHYTNTNDLAKTPEHLAKSGGQRLFEALSHLALRPLVALLIGWIAKGYL